MDVFFVVVLSYERDDAAADVVGDDLLHVAGAKRGHAGHGEEHVEGGDGGDGAGEQRDEAMATLLGYTCFFRTRVLNHRLVLDLFLSLRNWLRTPTTPPISEYP